MREMNLSPGEKKIEPKGQEENKLDRQGDQIGNDNGNGCDQAGKVDLAKKVGIGNKSVGCTGEAVGKVVPENRAGHIKQDLGEAIGGKAGNLAKDHCEHQGVHDGLDDQPQGTQNGLLITGDKISFNKERDQIAVVPDITELQVPPLLAGGDDQIPLLILICYFVV